MRAVEYVKAHANKEALKATASNVSESKVGTFAKSAKQDVSGLGISLLTSSVVYHAAVKAVTASGNGVAQGTGSLIHGVSFAAGAAGSGIAKGVGVASKKAGEKAQNASNTCNAHITDSAVWVKENGKKAASVVHSVGVSPTVTKATTRTASAVFLLNLVEAASKGRLAPVLLKTPVAGPYLAAVSIGGVAAYKAIALACGLSSTFALAARRDEALYVHRMPYGPSPSGLEDVFWNARCKAHEEAAKMFKAANKERKAAPDVDPSKEETWESLVDSAVASKVLNEGLDDGRVVHFAYEDKVASAVASMTDDEVRAFVNAVWGSVEHAMSYIEDQPLEDVVQALQDAIVTSSTTASPMQDAIVDAVDRAKSNGVVASSDSNA